MTNISVSFIAFINIFIIPILGLRVYAWRHKMKWENSPEIRYIYALLCVSNLPFARGIASIVEKIFLVSCHAETTKYTIIGIVSMIVLVFIVEIIEKYVQLHISISVRKTKYNSAQEKELVDEK